MKLVIAIIQPHKLEEVKAALSEVEVSRLTVLDCQGFGRQKGQSELYRGLPADKTTFIAMEDAKSRFAASAITLTA